MGSTVRVSGLVRTLTIFPSLFYPFIFLILKKTAKSTHLLDSKSISKLYLPLKLLIKIPKDTFRLWGPNYEVQLPRCADNVRK